jgi:hypothetical protein
MWESPLGDVVTVTMLSDGFFFNEKNTLYIQKDIKVYKLIWLVYHKKTRSMPMKKLSNQNKDVTSHNESNVYPKVGILQG